MYDTDLIVNDESNLARQVGTKMQELLTTWYGLLQATGGELIPDKCFWYLIDFTWNNKQWKYKSMAELPGQLCVKQTKGKTIIPRLKPNEAWRTLRVCIMLDGNDKAELQYLTEVAATWSHQMAKAHLTQTEAEFSLQQVLLPKLMYQLIATNFDEQHCYEILKLALG